jgi:hypothetical protein
MLNDKTCTLPGHLEQNLSLWMNYLSTDRLLFRLGESIYYVCMLKIKASGEVSTLGSMVALQKSNRYFSYRENLVP